MTSPEVLFASARITRSDPLGSFESCGAAAWRSLRASPWRTTEPPTPLLMIRPNFGETISFAELSEAGWMYRYPTKCSEVTRVPLFVARAKSVLKVKRAFLGSTRFSGAALLLTQRDESGL